MLAKRKISVNDATAFMVMLYFLFWQAEAVWFRTWMIYTMTKLNLEAMRLNKGFDNIGVR